MLTNSGDVRLCICLAHRRRNVEVVEIVAARRLVRGVITSNIVKLTLPNGEIMRSGEERDIKWRR